MPDKACCRSRDRAGRAETSPLASSRQGPTPRQHSWSEHNRGRLERFAGCCNDGTPQDRWADGPEPCFQHRASAAAAAVDAPCAGPACVQAFGVAEPCAVFETQLRCSLHAAPAGEGRQANRGWQVMPAVNLKVDSNAGWDAGRASGEVQTVPAAGEVPLCSDADRLGNGL